MIYLWLHVKTDSTILFEKIAERAGGKMMRLQMS